MLKNFFSPRSVAVIGASKNTRKLGHTILKNILLGGFRGKVYAVNPKYTSVLHKRCYPNVAAIKAKIELALIVIPAFQVTQVLEECGKKAIKNVIIISSGFAEIGQEGKKLEGKILDLSKTYNMNILGPNCLGILDSTSKLNASFAVEMSQAGETAFISQSGAIISAMLDWGDANNFGFSKIASLGNKIVLDEVDFLHFFISDEKTKAVLAYFEGIHRGEEFLSYARKLTLRKPFIVLKAGKSAAGERAIASHTASLAGDDRVVDAVFEKANIIRAHNLQEFFDYSLLFSWQPQMKGNGIAIVGNAGGPSVVAADFLSETKLSLASFSENTRESLKKNLPSMASIANPVDLVGDADAKRYEKALNIILQDKNVHGAMILLTPQTVTEVEKTAQVISRIAKKFGKTLIVSFIGGKKVLRAHNIFSRHRIPFYSFPHQGIRALEKKYLYYARNLILDKGNLQYKKICPDLKTYELLRKQLGQAKKENMVPDRSWIEKILRIYEIPVLGVKTVVRKEDVSSVLHSMLFPVVAKIHSADILHKSDVGAVITDIKNSEEAQVAFERIIESVKSKNIHARIQGVDFQEMLSGKMEVIIGGKRDKQFGPVVLFGLGGIYVEIFKDFSIKLAPVGITQAHAMIKEIRGYKILQGARGKVPYDTDAIAESINKISQLLIDFPEIDEIEINPAFVSEKGKGLVAVDFRMIT